MGEKNPSGSSPCRIEKSHPQGRNFKQELGKPRPWLKFLLGWDFPILLGHSWWILIISPIFAQESEINQLIRTLVLKNVTSCHCQDSDFWTYRSWLYLLNDKYLTFSNCHLQNHKAVDYEVRFFHWVKVHSHLSENDHRQAAQRAHDVNITSPQRRCNVMTLHRRWGDVVFTSCACRVRTLWGMACIFPNSIFPVSRTPLQLTRFLTCTMYFIPCSLPTDAICHSLQIMQSSRHGEVARIITEYFFFISC